MAAAQVDIGQVDIGVSLIVLGGIVRIPSVEPFIGGNIRGTRHRVVHWSINLFSRK